MEGNNMRINYDDLDSVNQLIDICLFDLSEKWHNVQFVPDLYEAKKVSYNKYIKNSIVNYHGDIRNDFIQNIIEQEGTLKSDISLLEAVLFAEKRPMFIDELRKNLKLSNERIKIVINKLKQRYRENDRAIQIVEYNNDSLSLQLKPENADLALNLNNRYMHARAVLEGVRVEMRLKPSYEERVQQFDKKPLLKLGPLRTLSYLAYHQPMLMKQIIEERGIHAKGHLKQMEEMGLINLERTEDGDYMITTTSFFGDYFGFSHNPESSRIQLRQIFREFKGTKLENEDIKNLFGGKIDGLDDLNNKEKLDLLSFYLNSRIDRKTLTE